MTTATHAVSYGTSRRYDHIFFPGMATFFLVTVFVGFAQTYYLSGVLKVPASKAILGPPLPLIVHLHAVVMSSWIVFLMVQTSLVAQHRVHLHRRLGLAGIGLASLMVLIGFPVSCAGLARLFPPGDPRIGFASTNFWAVLIFSILVYFGYRELFNPAAHKRLMLVATIQLLPAAIARWPIPWLGTSLAVELCCFVLLLLVAGYDLWSTGNVHRATLWGVIAFSLPLNPAFYESVFWRHFAIWMQSIGHFLR
jgi:hypothetical protein